MRWAAGLGRCRRVQRGAHDGTNTRRARLSAELGAAVVGALGDLWKVTLHIDAPPTTPPQLNEQPNFGPMSHIDRRGRYRRRHWTSIGRSARSGAWGTRLIEPIAQIVVGAAGGDSQSTDIPNEDSLDLEFTDANLFGFNRFPGVDRLEGGIRANVALHGAWYLGGTIDGLFGQSYRTLGQSVLPGVGPA